MAADQTTDEQIAQQVQQIPEMFGFLIDRYQSKLDRYIKRKTGLDKDLRDDILQDVFIKAYENIASFDPSLSFNAWIYRICHNTVINDWKKNKRYREGTSFDTEAGAVIENILGEDSVEFEVARNLLQTQIADALEQLSEKYQTIITLRYLEQLSYEEISTVLQIPSGTVATQLNRAKKQLTNLLPDNL